MGNIIFMGALAGVLLWLHKLEKMHDEVMRDQDGEK